jgi:hypothetical protein
VKDLRASVLEKRVQWEQTILPETKYHIIYPSPDGPQQEKYEVRATVAPAHCHSAPAHCLVERSTGFVALSRIFQVHRIAFAVLRCLF